MANPRERQSALNTLAYFDQMNLAEWITSPTLINIGLSDQTCPYDTIFPVFAKLKSVKGLMVYPDLDHNPSPDFNVQATAWLAQYLH